MPVNIEALNEVKQSRMFEAVLHLSGAGCLFLCVGVYI